MPTSSKVYAIAAIRIQTIADSKSILSISATNSGGISPDRVAKMIFNALRPRSRPADATHSSIYSFILSNMVTVSSCVRSLDALTCGFTLLSVGRIPISSRICTVPANGSQEFTMSMFASSIAACIPDGNSPNRAVRKVISASRVACSRPSAIARSVTYSAID